MAAADRHLADFGTNRSWLKFFTVLNILYCVLWQLEAIAGIKSTNKQDMKKLEPEHQEQLEIFRILYIILLVIFTIGLMLFSLPFIAELEKAPKLLLVFRTWTILFLIIEGIVLCNNVAEVVKRPEVIVSDVLYTLWLGLTPMVITTATLVYANRNIREAREKIGETSFSKLG